jgi:hypothetical protein
MIDDKCEHEGCELGGNTGVYGKSGHEHIYCYSHATEHGFCYCCTARVGKAKLEAGTGLCPKCVDYFEQFEDEPTEHEQ